jgi:DNA-binding NarL/FixJ family response regulator
LYFPGCMPIRIILADDHSAYRETLRSILNTYPILLVLGEASSGAEAIRLVREWRPDVALVDVRMKDMNGIDAVPAMLQHSPNTAVMMLSAHGDRQYVARAVKAGARGYLLKDAVTEVILEAIQTVHAGKPYFSARFSEFVD